MNKCLARKYVKFLFRRDPNFLDELTFTTPKYFKQLAFLKEKGIMQTYFTFRHPFNKVSALYFYLSRGWHPKTSRFSLFFSNAVLSNILLCLSKCITNALGYLGFAFVFELYFKKNGPMVR